MKQIIISGLLILPIPCIGQTVTKTLKYGGTYSYGSNVEKGRIGTIYIYPETDSTILFYIDLNRGAPSYNTGYLYGRVIIKNDNGTFYTKIDPAENGCKLIFKFSRSKLTIQSIEVNCGFGGLVYADGEFKKISKKPLDYFEDVEGKKVYFKTTKPEEYNKD